MSIVEGFKIIDICHANAKGTSVARGAGEFAFERFLQVITVEQTGQRVADGLFAQVTAKGFDVSEGIAQRPVGGELTPPGMDRRNKDKKK